MPFDTLEMTDAAVIIVLAGLVLLARLTRKRR
jgi:hypothetical protein